jgi:hypothetical protein
MLVAESLIKIPPQILNQAGQEDIFYKTLMSLNTVGGDGTAIDTP